MFDILYKSMILILIIVLGYGSKSVGLFSKARDFTTISNIVLYITLPSAIITNLNGLRFPPILLVISIFGFLCNWMYVFISSRFGKTKEEKSFLMLNINGYNIGNFAMPFIAFFLEGIPILAISLFDAGNSLMVLGGNYALAKNVKKEDSRFDAPDLLRTVIKSPTIIVYIVMVILSLASMDLPKAVIDVAAIVGGANTFLAMFLIGIALELKVDNEKVKRLVRLIFLRYVPAIILSAVIYLIPLIPIEIKYTLTLILLSPVAGSAPIFTSLLDNDVELSAQINSISIILSIILMSTFLMYLGV